jgi:membrane protein
MPDPMTESKLSTDEQVSSLWSLGGLSVGQLAKRVYRGVNDDYLLDRASALAYNFILAIFPLLLFLLAVFGISASHSSALQTDLFTYISQVLPPAAAQVISQTLQEVTKNAGGAKLTIGILLTLWFASGGMSSMISGLNGVYEVRESRSIVKVRLIALGLTVAISVLVLLALVGVLAGGYVANVLGSHYGLREATVIAWRVGQIVVALAFVIVSFSLIYYYGPDLEEQHWYWITPGALIGVLLWVAASFAFRGYLHFFNSYSKTYGSLGAAMILLMWLYITGFSFLIGGEINAQIEHAAALRGHPEAKAPGEKKAA